MITLSLNRKRLLYRAMHRGIKEADIILGRFAQARLPTMSDSEEAEFERLLELPDHDLYGWIIGRDPLPENLRGQVMTQLQGFNVTPTDG